MELQGDHGLLVVNLGNCISNAAAEQVVKRDSFYTVAVASDIYTNEDEAVMHIPLSVHCPGEVQQTLAAVTQLSAAQQHYGEKQDKNRHYEQIEFKEQSHLAEQQEDHINQQNGVTHDDQRLQHSSISSHMLNAVQDSDGSYYSEICNYLSSQILPQGVTESYKKVLRKRAQNYRIIDGELYYGHKQPKRVITEKAQQQEILRSVHIDEETGVHLGLKKMHYAINQNYFWRGLHVDVANFVRECNDCSEPTDARNANDGNLSKEYRPLNTKYEDNSNSNTNIPVANPRKVWQEVEVRIFGPYPRTESHNAFIVGIIDPCSCWIIAHPILGNDLGISAADTIYKTFCMFGFAKCNIINMEHHDIEIAQSRYDEYVMPLQDLMLTSGSPVPKTLISMKEGQSHCEWATRMFDEFVAANSTTWDEQLDKFIFEFSTKLDKESSSPFIRMFGRSPVSSLEENKENSCSDMLQQDNIQELPKRRRLQSSMLQCRHCEEIFTSKISFRIHQRKHTEEAQRQGTLEGEEPLRLITERERGMLRRAAMKRKQRLMRQGTFGLKQRLLAVANRLKIQNNVENLSKDRMRAELQAHTVATVRRLLAATKEARRRRGRYHKYSTELQEEMARYALEHGNLKAVRHFSKKMNTTVSESTIRNIVKLYCSYTPKLKMEIGKYASEVGVDAACSHFSERLGQEVRRGLVHKFKKLYNAQHPNVELELHSGNQKNNSASNAKQEEFYSEEQASLYASQPRALGAAHCFAQKLSSPLKKAVACKLHKVYIDKQGTEQQVAAMPQLSSALVDQQGIASNSTQTVDILHAPVNILNGNQVNNTATVLYNSPFQTLPHIHSTNQLTTNTQGSNSMPLTYSSITQCSNEALVSTNIPFAQPQETTLPTNSVIMNQNPVNFHQSSLPMQAFQESRALFSAFNNEIQSEKGIVTGSERTLVPLSLNHRDQQMPPQPSHNDIAPQVSTFTVAIAPTHVQHGYPEVLLPPQQTSSVVQSRLGTELSLLPSIDQSNTTTVHHIVAMPQVQQQQSSCQQPTNQDIHSPQPRSGNNFSTHTCDQQTLLQTHGQVVVQQPSVLANPVMLEATHTQIIEPLTVDTSNALANDGSSETPFGSSHASTLIARQDGIYSITNSIHGEDSVPENDTTSRNQATPIAVHMPEEETPQDGAEVLISIIPQEEMKRMQNKNKAMSPCSGTHIPEQTKVIHVVKVDCSREENAEDLEDVDDPAPLPKQSLKRRKSETRGKKLSSGSHRRGNYTVYSPEIRAEMGKYAAEHGSQQASKHFKAVLGHAVPESTIRGLRDKYLLKREHGGNQDGEVISLGYAPRGRPMRLGKYDEVVQECIRELIKSGERVSSFLAITTAKQVLMQYDPGLLEENGGNVKLNVTWAKSFLKRIGAQNNS